MTEEESGRPVVDGESRLLIDGKLTEASSGATFDNVDPATEEVLGETCDATSSDMEAAVAAARRAFDETSWSTDHTFRRRCLEQLHAALVSHQEELRAVTVAEVGSPLLLTYAFQLDGPVADFAYWVEMTTSYEYERSLPEREVYGQRQRRLIWREPIGVVGAITPWNFPTNLNLAKLGPALAAGNAVVLKPAPDTPWSATTLGRLVAEETDIPAGIVNVVASSDHLVGEVLTTDPRVDMITFTGSTVTGRRIMAKASDTVKKVFLELGGKSAYVVLDDADANTAASMGAMAVCVHSGQGCAIPTRMLVPRPMYDEMVDLVAQSMGNISVGDPWDASNMQGPLVSARQRDRVLGYIEKGKKEGARLVRGGATPEGLEKGFFVEPTLFADVDPKSTIAQEEIFGPVQVMIPYDDDDEAVRIANDSIYGLSGAVLSSSEERALAVARRIRAGTFMVNGGIYAAVDVPFGGYRQSGLGRENGVEGFEEYLETKALGLPAV